jgi:predicted amidohydrolase
MKNLTVSMLQINVTDCAQANIEKALAMARSMDRSTGIFVLPELWTGNYRAEDSPRALGAISGVCAELGMYAVSGTLPWAAGGVNVNRAWIVNDAGEPFAFYDKAHLFSPSGEDKIFKAGNAPLMFDFNGLRCAVAVCYDIRFPEFTRSLGLAGARVIFVPALWPKSRRGAWSLLLRSAAAAAQAFVVGCAAAGRAPGSVYFGGSMIASPWGDELVSLGEGEDMLTLTLDMSETDRCKKALPLERDRRPELYGFLLG